MFSTEVNWLSFFFFFSLRFLLLWASELWPMASGHFSPCMAHNWQPVLLSQPKKPRPTPAPRLVDKSAERGEEQQEVIKYNDEIQNETDRLNKPPDKGNLKVEQKCRLLHHFFSRRGQNWLPKSQTMGSNICQASTVTALRWGRLQTGSILSVQSWNDRIWRHKIRLQNRFLFWWWSFLWKWSSLQRISSEWEWVVILPESPLKSNVSLERMESDIQVTQKEAMWGTSAILWLVHWPPTELQGI